MKYVTLTIAAQLWMQSHLLLNAQIVVSEISTDFNGGLTSGDGSAGFAGISSTTPDTEHNLTSFSFLDSSGSRATMPTQGGTIQGGIYAGQSSDGFCAFPVSNALGRDTINGSFSDGSTSTNLGPPISVVEQPNGLFDLAPHLIDGVNGLGMGTGANNVLGNYTFGVSGLLLSAIGDGVPDVIMPQLAVWRSGDITFDFLDSNGNTVGNSFGIGPSAQNKVGNWVTDRWRYIDNNPNDGIGEGLDTVTTVNEGRSTEVNGRKDISIIAFDFSQMGVTTANINSIETLNINFTGQPDPGFVAYNKDSIEVTDITIPEPSSLLFLGIGLTVTLRRNRG